MDDYFELPVTYKGEEYLFPVRLVQTGYTHKLEVNVDGVHVFFEPDDEQNYRALVDEFQLKNFKIEVGLLQAIAEVIESMRK
ncbi:hypothetical protein AHMF7605_22445 [Adhaeribacter arboris]|uniref:Uncharacterized protein n=1 Tax=Adhaeribacter arboris TaxID=2072846 RepID=A0A2T2YKM9_9BACT|nr:hypothetical protein [Adhaeribacter arboris]PSR56061.1 hypothetical protein AHMF7605_22445 [Adhaeribacter arboris]